MGILQAQSWLGPKFIKSSNYMAGNIRLRIFGIKALAMLPETAMEIRLEDFQS
ncbi:hypothetical protein ECTPHS_12758 [Ectothiorhodospira sp. PHS-1]|nr:hypothetical protein ECTPHS_12758 [Ectothiorhodospira sp. PHS-1]